MLFLKPREAPSQLIVFKAIVQGHTRHKASGGLVIVRPYVNRTPAAHHDTRQHSLFDHPGHVDIRPRGEPPVVPGLDLASYDHVVVAFSGGKDSIASVVALMEAGVPRDKIELWHHDVDGGGDTLMDWPITPAYTKAVAQAIGLPVYFSYREGGIEREMLRQNTPTAAVVFDTPDRGTVKTGGISPKLGTRRQFPQVSADLKTRWCSGAVKVDVMASAIRNQDRFTGKRTLVVTGERAEESSNRAKYKTFEPHRTMSQSRHVDHYRPVHDWSEQQAWDAMKRYGIVAHPAYHLGYSRLSCRNCIFGNPDQWATNRAHFPETVAKIARYESEFNKTIHRTEDVNKRADKGKPYQASLDNPALVKLADSHEWHGPVIVDPKKWRIPAGAFGNSGGPS